MKSTDNYGNSRLDDEECRIARDDSDVNIIALGNMAENFTEPTAITVKYRVCGRSREATIKFSTDDPLSTVCAIVRLLGS